MKMLSGVSNQEITYNEFLEKVDAGEVESVEITDGTDQYSPQIRRQGKPVHARGRNYLLYRTGGGMPR